MTLIFEMVVLPESYLKLQASNLSKLQVKLTGC